ncbi:MAG: hypothetical protein K2O11_07910, partial [Oscillospiraceae bacterium]|nr:hypothetical protein [Oscillospiraceae bacterium]
FIWFAFPAPNDVLRSESATPTVDFVAQVFQIAIAAALCAVVNVTRDKPMKRGYLAGIAACVGLYLAGWAAYYAGIVNAAVILDLCLAPCGAFLIFALGRKNAIALVSAAAFAVGHLLAAVLNFLK